MDLIHTTQLRREFKKRIRQAGGIQIPVMVFRDTALVEMFNVFQQHSGLSKKAAAEALVEMALKSI